MNNLSQYIIEKLHINKDIKDDNINNLNSNEIYKYIKEKYNKLRSISYEKGWIKDGDSYIDGNVCTIYLNTKIRVDAVFSKDNDDITFITISAYKYKNINDKKLKDRFKIKDNPNPASMSWLFSISEKNDTINNETFIDIIDLLLNDNNIFKF